jgi:hypothetical protein
VVAQNMYQEFEIVLYRIEVLENYKLFNLIKWNRKIEYLLTYRIAEDRFWFVKKINGAIVDDHITKNNMLNSLYILDGIAKRLEFFQSILKYNFSIWRLEKEDEKLFLDVAKISRNVTEDKNEKQLPQKKVKIRGLFLNS